ncbi:MAG TPA: hydrolase [Solimonas sp.]|nr:hydrolase [Solimonas sp.]
MSVEVPTRPHGRVVHSQFRPHPLLRNPHLQTLGPFLLRSAPELALRVERMETPDGDFIDIGWSGEQNAGASVAVLIHGLTGGFQSKYLRGLAQRLIAKGWRIAILLLRGAGETNRTHRFYNHGDTADLRWLWQQLQLREPQTRIVSVGWSLGGNVLLKAMSEEGTAAIPERVVAASVPFRLRECVDRLRSGFSRLYQQRMLTDLKSAIRLKHQRVPVPHGVNLEATLKARDFYEFDDAYTAPLNGYRDANDYYARAACGQYLDRIHRSTLVINAVDDPFMTPDIVPAETQLAPDVTLELAHAGGHVGFVSAGVGGRLEYWLEARIADWIGAP